MKYYRIWSKGKASLSCWMTHWAEVWLVTLKCMNILLLWSIMKKTNKMLKLIVGTMKKSIADMTLWWFLRKVIQDSCFFLPGFLDLKVLKYRETVTSETSLKSSINNSEYTWRSPSDFHLCKRKHVSPMVFSRYSINQISNFLLDSFSTCRFIPGWYFSLVPLKSSFLPINNSFWFHNYHGLNPFCPHLS